MRALRVVEAVAAAGDGVTAKAIARRLGSPLPTVYRALGILVEEGYLVRLHDVRGYGLGYRVAELQRGLVEQLRPAAGVRSILYEVHTAGRAAAYLVVPRDVDIVVAHVDDCLEHPRPEAMRVGEPTAAHAIAAGKVMLAALRPGAAGRAADPVRAGPAGAAHGGRPAGPGPRADADPLRRRRGRGGGVPGRGGRGGRADPRRRTARSSGRSGSACRTPSSPPAAGSWSGWCGSRHRGRARLGRGRRRCRAGAG